MRKTRAAHRNALRVGMHTAEMMLAAPHVMAHRLSLLSTPYAATQVRNQRELYRMSSEKLAAFGESWTAMASQMMQANQQLARMWMAGAWLPMHASQAALLRAFGRAATQVQAAALQTIASGIAPVRNRAVANSKRLRRSTIR